MMLKFTVAPALIVAATTPAGAAVITYHNNAQTFVSSLSNVSTETFDDEQLVDGLAISGPTNVITGDDDLYHLLRSGASSIFAFDGGVSGFGWSIRSSGLRTLDMTLTFDDGSQHVLAPLSLDTTYKFFGFTSDKAIVSATLTARTTSQYYIDELKFGDAPVAAVPEPAAWAMMIAGLGIAGGSFRRSRARVVTYA
jgi:hypothetical protein